MAFETCLNPNVFMKSIAHNAIFDHMYRVELTVLPAKNDSDVLFRLQSYQGF